MLNLFCDLCTGCQWGTASFTRQRFSLHQHTWVTGQASCSLLDICDHLWCLCWSFLVQELTFPDVRCASSVWNLLPDNIHSYLSQSFGMTSEGLVCLTCLSLAARSTSVYLRIEWHYTNAVLLLVVVVVVVPYYCCTVLG